MAEDSERLRGWYEAQVRMLGERLALQERELAVLASEVHSTENVQSVFEIALDPPTREVRQVPMDDEWRELTAP